MINKIDRMHWLVREISKANLAYYKYDRPVMSDRAYNQLVEELRALENETGITLSGSPIHKVAGELLEELKKVQHTRPMLSVDDTQSMEKAFRFINGRSVVVSWKMDGLTLVLRYDKGELTQAITRGAEGRIGEDVTHTVKVMTNVPLKIPYAEPLELRGEGVMSWENFDTINEGLEDPYSHPRNLAAGCVRRKDAQKSANFPLEFYAFEVVSEVTGIREKHEQLHFLKELGFDVVSHKVICENSSRTQVESDFNTFAPKAFAYPADGLIIEYNDLDYGSSLGATGHHENRMLAFKWIDDLYITKFLGLELATTRTGMVSLTAMFEDVDIDGTNVNRAYLHNVDIVEKLKLGIGDEISVYKANMIIPQVAENHTMSRTLELPTECPCCGTEVELRTSENGTRMLFCPSKSCPAQLLGKFVHFCDKTRMDLPGFSEKTLSKLIGAGFIKNFGDLFCLHSRAAEIATLDGFGPISARKMIDTAELARKCRLNQFIAGLGIHTVGRSAGRVLNEYFKGNWEAFENAIKAGFDFTILPDFGYTMNKNIYDWYADTDAEKLWRPALQYIEFINEEEKENMSTETNTFTGKTIVVTGKLENFTRSEIQDQLLALGARPTGSISSKTDYLIAGEAAGSKLKKARDLGVAVISEADFERLAFSKK